MYLSPEVPNTPAEHQSREYEMEVIVWPRPRVFHIVNLEFGMRRYLAGLYWTEIHPNDFGLGVQICKLSGPDTGSAPKI